MRIERKYNYYLVLVAISAIVAILMHFPEIISMMDDDPSELFPGMSVTDVVSEVIYAFLSLLLLFFLNLRLFAFDRPGNRVGWQKIFLSLLFTWVVSSLLWHAFVFIHSLGYVPAVEAITHSYLHPLRDGLITLIVSGTCYIIHLIQQSHMVQLENQHLQAENLVNKYEALKNQLNPHMLFNSLNTLRSLIRETPVRAQDYVQELSHVLRYTLQENQSKNVTLQEEMDFVRSYVFLMKMRYEENLDFNIRITEEYLSYVLPPMSVQLLIENAVKHNEISSRYPLRIHLFTDDAKLTVINPIQPKRTPYVGTGIGLANLRKRYQLLFRKEIKITTENKQFSVTIPLIKNEK